MPDEKTNTTEPEDENPNVEESHEFHEKHPEMGGHPGGKNEGSDTGSRGDHKRHHSGSNSGSRTNKK